jgi:protein-disulfide isomerase
VNEGGEGPGLVCRNRDALAGWSPAADDPEHPLASQRDAHRAVRDAGGHGAQLRVRPDAAFAAEAAATNGASRRTFLRLEAKHLRQAPAVPAVN